MKRVRNQYGFTVTEMLIVLAIMGALLGIAALSIGEYQRRTVLKEGARSLEGFLYNARTAARTRQATVLVSITSSGYTSFIDRNGDDEYNAGDDLIGTETASRLVQLQGYGGFTVPGIMRFNALGGLNPSSNVYVHVVSVGDSNKRYQVTVFQYGATRVEKTESGGPPWTRAW